MKFKNRILALVLSAAMSISMLAANSLALGAETETPQAAVESVNGLTLIPIDAAEGMPADMFGQESGEIFSVGNYYYKNYQYGAVAADGNFTMDGASFVPNGAANYRYVGGANFDETTGKLQTATASAGMVDTNNNVGKDNKDGAKNFEAYKSALSDDKTLAALSTDDAISMIRSAYKRAGQNGVGMGARIERATFTDGIYREAYRFSTGSANDSNYQTAFRAFIVMGYDSKKAVCVADEFMQAYSADISSYGRPLDDATSFKLGSKTYKIQYFEKQAIVSSPEETQTVYIHKDAEKYAAYQIPKTQSGVYTGELQSLIDIAGNQNMLQYSQTEVADLIKALLNASLTMASADASQVAIYDCVQTLKATIKDMNAKPIPVPEYIKSQSVKLSAQAKTITVGRSYALKASVYPANATNASVFWSSSKNSVATVTSSGKLKAVSPGEAKITAKTVDGAQATIKITVIPKTPSKPSVKKKGRTATIKFKKVSKTSGTAVYLKKNGKKFKRIKSTTKSSYKKRLSKGRYQIKLKSYKKVGKKRYYSNYSKTVKFRIK